MERMDEVQTMLWLVLCHRVSHITPYRTAVVSSCNSDEVNERHESTGDGVSSSIGSSRDKSSVECGVRGEMTG